VAARAGSHARNISDQLDTQPASSTLRGASPHRDRPDTQVRQVHRESVMPAISACLWEARSPPSGPRPALRSWPQVRPEGGRQASERPVGSTTWAPREPHRNPTSPRRGPAPTGIPRTRRHSAAHLGTHVKIGLYMSTEQRKTPLTSRDSHAGGWWSGTGSNCRPSAFQSVAREPEASDCYRA
jgi:hypothetical protein